MRERRIKCIVSQCSMVIGERGAGKPVGAVATEERPTLLLRAHRVSE